MEKKKDDSLKEIVQLKAQESTQTLETIKNIVTEYLPSEYSTKENKVIGFFMKKTKKKSMKIENLDRETILQYCKSLDLSEKSQKSGDELEKDTLSLIKDELKVEDVNIGKRNGNKDLEWRTFIEGKEKVISIMEEFKYSSLAEVMINYDLHKEKLTTKKSTPVDVYSDEAKVLAIAGGGAKFDEAKKGELKQHALARVLELIEISKEYGYKPYLIFNKKTVPYEWVENLEKYFSESKHIITIKWV
ncbi:hypothetical protein [Aureispira sp. CCB-QB1]|uniref:hypothetical protein n=1 Tax=Aureispira sp. CCB-QB1 TaxID=1313421 RepID=UPI0006975B81|nr:hypothetical protein [Aureispira sp. CCB-QB1]